jgi:predicted nucleic acid-binding protein
VIGELLAGFSTGSRAAKNQKELSDFLALPQITHLVIDRRTAQRYADVYHGLQRAGTPVPTNDLWIAASALEFGFAVFTFDQHFRHILGLQFGQTVNALS